MDDPLDQMDAMLDEALALDSVDALLDKAIKEEPIPPNPRTAKRRAKKAKMAEAARRERDWLADYREGNMLLVPPPAPEIRVQVRGGGDKRYPETAPKLRSRSERVNHVPAPPPTRTEDRSVEELYRLLQERYQRAGRYEDRTERRRALENAQRVVVMLRSRGESDESIKAALGLS